jgi:uncharacterized repeat protein (TIGR02543 family)
MKQLWKKLVSLFLCLTLLLSFSSQVMAADDSSDGAASPPAKFEIYINVDGFTQPTLIKSYTGTEMRLMAKESKSAYLADENYPKVNDNGLIYYTAYSSYGPSGRVVSEYVLIDKFMEGIGVDFEEGDYLIMGDDYTIDPKYSDEYNYGSADDNYQKYWKNYGWYNYNDLFSDRYYYKDWNAEDSYKVPAVIAMKSYGGKGWTEETYWDMYAGSADYLWAYVVNFGMTDNMSDPENRIYDRYYYGNTECTIKLAADSAVDPLVEELLAYCRSEAETELAKTQVANEASEVAEGYYWVTLQQKTALNNALSATDNVGTTNSEVYESYLSLLQSLDDFKAAKQAGIKTGYAWFSEEQYETQDVYYISTVNQMQELANLVNGTADLGSGMADAYDFADKTVFLSNDIDLARYRIIIGNEENPFAGTFDGQGYSLSNLRINVDYGNVALFGCNRGTIKNLTVSGTVNSGLDDKENPGKIAGIVACNYGIVDNCINKATVEAVNALNVGGVAGRNEGIVKNCLNTAAVTGYQDVGGIVGYNYDSVQLDEAMISECLNAGTIKALFNGTGEKENSNVGGIAGGVGADMELYPIIENCINSGSVVTSGKTAGGIIGGAWISELTVKNCYNIGNVSTENENGENIGAVLGRTKATVEKCYWLAETAEQGIGYTNNGAVATECSTEDLIHTDLGTGFVAHDNGWPTLKWQKVYQVGFDTKQQAVIEPQSIGEYLTAVEPVQPVIENKTFNGWFADTEYQNKFDFKQMITDNTTIYGKFTANNSGNSGGSGGGTVAETFSLTFETNGGESIAKVQKAAGSIIDLSEFVPVKNGYDFAGWYADAGLTESVTQIKLNSNQTVYAKWTSDQTGVCDGGDNCPSKKFSDLDPQLWYHVGVDYVLTNNLMTGISDTAFAPNSTATRGMIVTILYRMENQPQLSSECKFTDVLAGKYYYNAVIWASENNIVKGVSETLYDPEADITREELAAIMNRYCQYKGYDVSSTADLSDFSDQNTISLWAVNNMKWAVGVGLISGNTDGTLNPTGDATRAEIAVILERFCTEYLSKQL